MTGTGDEESGGPVERDRAAATEPRPTTRPAGYFRAIVVSALASLAPAAGCYESYAELDDAEDAAPADAAADEAEVNPCEDCAVYSTPDYGVPANDAGPEIVFMYGVP